MQIKENATILTAESKPWEIEGRSGVSHVIRALIGTEIYPVKATEEAVATAQALIGKKTPMTVNLSSRKENIKLEFVNFKE